MRADIPVPDVSADDDAVIAPGGTRSQPPPARTPAERVAAALRLWMPLVGMTLLALFSWWLVKLEPTTGGGEEKPQRNDPDYVLHGLTLERFTGTGARAATINGTQLRHYPDRDAIEIDSVRIEGRTDAGLPVVAQAARAVIDGRGHWARLLGGAEVSGVNTRGEDVRIRGEVLHADLQQHRVTADQPVELMQGSSHFRAGGLIYDQDAQTVQLQGRVKAVLTPPPGKR